MLKCWKKQPFICVYLTFVYCDIRLYKKQKRYALKQSQWFAPPYLHYFCRLVYNPVEHLWWCFYCENSKPLNIFTKKLHCIYSLGFQIHLCFLKALQKFYFFKVFYIRILWKSVISLEYVTSVNSSNILLNITRTKALINNLLMSKF